MLLRPRKDEEETSKRTHASSRKDAKQLPDELTEEQLKKVHRIVTGGHRPIRQALRRHPFQHLEFIDKEVREMERHGIVKKGVDFVWNPGIPSASANSIRSSYENEVEERSVEVELAEDSIRAVRGNEGGINLLVGESLPKRHPEDDPAT